MTFVCVFVHLVLACLRVDIKVYGYVCVNVRGARAWEHISAQVRVGITEIASTANI